MDSNLFNDLKIHEEVKEILKNCNFNVMTEVQSSVIPEFIKKDVIVQSQTGSGKTLSYLIPILNYLYLRKNETTFVSALIIVPTRELSIQILEVLKKFKFTSEIFIGGSKVEEDLEKLKRPFSIAIGTPGRLQEIISKNSKTFSKLKFVVLDESDKLLSYGFEGKLKRILAFLPKNRLTGLFSATINDSVNSLAQSFLKAPALIKVTEQIPEKLNLNYLMVSPKDKIDTLAHLIYKKKSIVFFSTCNTTDYFFKLFSKIFLCINKKIVDVEKTESIIDLKNYKNSLDNQINQVGANISSFKGNTTEVLQEDPLLNEAECITSNAQLGIENNNTTNVLQESPLNDAECIPIKLMLGIEKHSATDVLQESRNDDAECITSYTLLGIEKQNTTDVLQETSQYEAGCVLSNALLNTDKSNTTGVLQGKKLNEEKGLTNKLLGINNNNTAAIKNKNTLGKAKGVKINTINEAKCGTSNKLDIRESTDVNLTKEKDTISKSGKRGNNEVINDVLSDEIDIQHYTTIFSDFAIHKIHGKMDQRDRNKIYSGFERIGGALFCTDVAARGIDFQGVDLVVHFDVPKDHENIIHRSGRTARNGQEGDSIVFLMPNEKSLVDFLKLKGVDMEEKALEIEDKKIANVLLVEGNDKNNKNDPNKSNLETFYDRGKSVMDKTLLTSSVKSFVSYVRGYKEHILNYILNYKELDYNELADLHYLEKIPSMAELKNVKFKKFEKPQQLTKRRKQNK